MGKRSKRRTGDMFPSVFFLFLEETQMLEPAGVNDGGKETELFWWTMSVPERV
jgi:hypothetical protein